jgi:hypothetical protein
MHQRPQAQRHRQQRHNSETPIEPHHHHEAADEKEHIAHPRKRGLRGHALDLANVAVDPRNFGQESRDLTKYDDIYNM